MIVLYLNKIIIKGFKSFADKTEIVFTDGITTVVGPNGSGKSNISDAIRWVLGEQSVKNLRGAKMSDVIFSGTESRKALGYAEVIIQFNNDDKKIPLEFNEIEISRRMYRSGESEYFINKHSARLRDVRELFLDTGIGKDGYSIIGQGKIDEILSNKPEDRRGIFEEAAGINKYKFRKDETVRKLDKTEANLLRLKDLLFEIRQNEKKLKVEAEKASEFKILYEQYRNMDISLSMQTHERIRKNIDEINSKKEFFNDELKEQKNIKNKIENSFAPFKKKIEDIEESIKRENENKSSKIRQFDSYVQNLSFNKDKISDLEKKLVENAIKENETDKKYQKYIEIEKNAKEEFLTNEKELETLNLELNNIKIKKGIEEDNNYENILHKNLELKTDIDSINNNKNQELEKIKNYENLKLSTIENCNEYEVRIEEFSSRKKNLENKLNDIQVKLNTIKKQYQDNYININKIVSERKKKEEELSELSADIKVKIKSQELYRNIEDSYEGYYRSVKEIMKKNYSQNPFSDKVTVVSEVFSVKAEFETAIEALLSSQIQNIIVKNEYIAKEIIEYLKKNKYGRAVFLPLNRFKVKENTIKLKDSQNLIGKAIDIISFDDKYRAVFEYLLGNSLIVKDMDTAIVFSNKNKGFKIATLDGEIVNPSGSISGGYINKSGFISSKNKMKDLETSIKEKKEIFKIKELELEDIDNNMNNLNEKSSGLKSAIEDMLKDEDKNKKEKDSLSLLLKMEEQKYEELKNNVKSYEAQIKQSKNKLEEMLARLEDKKNLLIENTQNLEEEKEFRKKNELIKEGLKNKEIELAVKIKEKENTLKTLQISLKEAEDFLKDYPFKKEEFANLSLTVNNSIEKLKEENKNYFKYLKENENFEQEVNFKINALIKEKESFLNEIYDFQDKLSSINDKIEDINSKMSKEEVSLTRNKVIMENIESKLIEDYNFIISDNLDFKKTKCNQTELRELKNKIDDIGDVSLSSIEDHKLILERLDFLQEQYDDLVDAKKDLENIINEIDSNIESQFKENFKIIKDNFKSTFRELFGGGEADIYMADKDNILQTGIEIDVKPPGKKMQALSLLSGGEKTLTAIALLLAILKSKPSPFCILDEIDAALDDNNIEKYTSYLEKIKKNTQFILITHRKITMEISDAIYGISMKEKGISSILSLKIEGGETDV